MNVIKVSLSDPGIKQIVKSTYPEYRGRKVRLCTLPEGGKVRFSDNYWDGGSRSYWAACRLDNGAAVSLESGSPYRDQHEGQLVEVPFGCVVVEHSIFCGKDAGLRIYVRAENLAPLLPVKSAVL